MDAISIPNEARRAPRRLLSAACLTVAVCACGPPGAGGTTDASAPSFVDRTNDWGLAAPNSVAFSGAYPLPEIMGSGVAVFDANGDDRLDLYVADAGPGRSDAALDRLFLGREGGGFVDATEESGLVPAGWSTGVAAGDVDNDGDVDLYVAAWGPDRLLINDGHGHFQDATAESGIAGDHVSMSATFLDFDLDGYLDIFVTHYVVPLTGRTCGGAGGGLDYCSPGAHRPVPDTLYRGRGDGTFEDVSLASGIGAAPSTGLGVAAADFDDDGDIDIYVANDQRPNQFWSNQGNGLFVDEAFASGVALSGMAAAEASMGIDVCDADGDGRLDLFLTHLTGETSTLYSSDEHGTFRDASADSGVGAATRDLTGFGTVFADIDLDGRPDLLVTNGAVAHDGREPDPARPFERYVQRCQLLRSTDDGRFEDRGGWSTEPTVGRGLATGDLDGDGDLDVVVTAVGSPARVFENVADRRGRWLLVRALDPDLRRVALGARVEVRAAGRVHVRVAGAGWSYLSSSSADVHVGLGDVDVVEGIDVVWPGGERESFEGGEPDRVVVVRRGTGR